MTLFPNGNGSRKGNRKQTRKWEGEQPGKQERKEERERWTYRGKDIAERKSLVDVMAQGRCRGSMVSAPDYFPQNSGFETGISRAYG
jgi:hypothetical protein